MIGQHEVDDFAGFDDLIADIEASPEFREESLVADAQAIVLQAMIDRNISRTELAAAMGVSKARVSQMLSPVCKNFTVRLLGRTAHALDLDLRLVRAEDVVARKSASGAWCIGMPWEEPSSQWQHARLKQEDRAANENRTDTDFGTAASYLVAAAREAREAA